jgi:hypothetical protein
MAGTKLASLLLSIAALSVFALVWGGVVTWRKGDRQKGVLMMLCALVLLVNLLIWTL